MNLKNKKLRDDYIDLSKIIISLWEKKFLIFIVTLIFMVAGYSFVKNQPQNFSYELTIEDVKIDDLSQIFPWFVDENTKRQLTENFNETLIANFLSTEKMKEFEKNYQKDSNQVNININQIDNIKKSITRTKSQKISKPLEYYRIQLVSPIKLPTDFLKSYINYLKKESTAKLKNNLYYYIQIEIDKHVYHLQIAKKIDLEDPIFLKRSIPQGNSIVINDNTYLYYQGTKVLTQFINQLEELKIKINQNKLDLNLIINIKSKGKVYNQSIGMVIFISFVLGLFLSIFFIFFRMIIFR